MPYVSSGKRSAPRDRDARDLYVTHVVADAADHAAWNKSACGGWRRMWQAWHRPIRCGGGFTLFFQFVRLDSALAARVVVELLGPGGKPWVLAIDRTNWDFGKTTINILMICVLQKHMRGGVMN